MVIRSPVKTLQLGSVFVFYKQHCPVSMKFHTQSPIPSSLEDDVEWTELMRSSWPAFPKASAVNVMGLTLMWIMIMDC